MARNLNSGRSSGAAGTRPPAKTEGYAAVKTAKQQKQTSTGAIQGTAGGSASNRISAAPKAQKNGTFQKASGKKPAVQPVARANTPDRIANRMATIQSKKGGR